jgi:thioredoxin reductase
MRVRRRSLLRQCRIGDAFEFRRAGGIAVIGDGVHGAREALFLAPLQLERDAVPARGRSRDCPTMRWRSVDERGAGVVCEAPLRRMGLAGRSVAIAT